MVTKSLNCNSVMYFPWLRQYLFYESNTDTVWVIITLFIYEPNPDPGFIKKEKKTKSLSDQNTWIRIRNPGVYSIGLIQCGKTNRINKNDTNHFLRGQNWLLFGFINYWSDCIRDTGEVSMVKIKRLLHKLGQDLLDTPFRIDLCFCSLTIDHRIINYCHQASYFFYRYSIN